MAKKYKPIKVWQGKKVRQLPVWMILLISHSRFHYKRIIRKLKYLSFRYWFIKHLSSGRNRDVYFLPGKKYIVKIPRNEDGMWDNATEHDWRHAKDAWSQTFRCNANCRMVPGSYLLVMEYVRPVDSDEIRAMFGEVPDWVGCVDCGQVGLNRKGELKAYDYA